MTPSDVVDWMLQRLAKDGCLYQDDVVDFLVRSKAEGFLRENSEGNQVLELSVLKAFESLTEKSVVWVRSDFYWRHRVAEDEDGRIARG
jgi:hypothetical protein